MLPRPLRSLFAPSRQRLVTLVRDELRAAGVDPAALVYDDTEFQFRLPDDSTLFLGNLLRECHLLWPWQRRARVRRFVGLYGEGSRMKTPAFAEARERLLPGVRDAVILDVVRLQALVGGQPHPGVPSRRLGTRLRLCLFLDSAESTVMVTNDDLQTWGKTFEEVLQVALDNLEARSPGGLTRHEGVYVAPWSDCYDPARALLRSRMSSVEVQGEMVAFMPNWNHLIVTGSGDGVGMTSALAFATRVMEEEPRCMSARPLVWRDGDWIDLELPRGHVLEPGLRKARVMEMVGVYRDQTEQLGRYHEAAGIDVFVAAYTGTCRDDDDYSSYCVWTRGVATLLPRTETIHFFDPEAGSEGAVVGHFDWDLVALHCADLMTRTEWTQERYLVEQFPSEAQLERMRQSQAQRDGGRRAD